MTKTLPCDDKLHKKVKRDANEAGLTIKAYIAKKLGIIILLGVVISFGGLAYAQSSTTVVSIPFPTPWEQSCIYTVMEREIKYSCLWEKALPDEVVAQIHRMI